MDEWNWNPDGDYMSYQEELLYRLEEEGPFSPEDAVEVEWTPFEDSDLTF